MSVPAARQWRVGDRVRFAHIPEPSARYYEIQKIVRGGPFDGMLELEGLTGQFAPHLFVGQKPAGGER